MSPEFEWDENKATGNFAVHGVAFHKASLVFLDPRSIEELDDRVDYGEDRYIRLGMSEGQLLSVVYTEREAGKIRIISARKANQSEKKAYQSQNPR